MKTSSQPPTIPRKRKDRQKIQMKRMVKESNLLVTFSKCRSGLFKKASELCILCRVEIAVIVFSPGKKIFSFGHSSVEMVVDRFLTQNPPPNLSTPQLVLIRMPISMNSIDDSHVEKSKSEELTKLAAFISYEIKFN
ncbi:LOW QUALITY PROTEIN: hypothetical protein OSB04_026599, partial [Centaurea solstitialis]